MTPSIVVHRRAQLPDPARIERCRRLPELGPSILFLSGGSALRGLSRKLKLYTTNSIHLITPFDSGGSSALLRKAFRMPAVGDLRNRLMALADETEQGNPGVYALFSHRFAADGARPSLAGELDALVRGAHPLMERVPSALARLIRTHLRLFVERMPPAFDLRGASIGNLILAGGYLNNERDLESVLFLFSRLVQVRGKVALSVTADCHLTARLADGTDIVGQHRITARAPGLPSRIIDLGLTASLESRDPVSVDVDPRARDLIAGADLVVYPMGSFYTSVVANLLPRGLGAAVVRTSCPKIYVPSTGFDPELSGSSVGESVEALIQHVRRDVAARTPVASILDAVLLDEDDASYDLPLEVGRIERLGIQVLRLPLRAAEAPDRLDPERLAHALLSIA